MFHDQMDYSAYVLLFTFKTVQESMSNFPANPQACIHLEECSELADMSKYYFDGKGKSVRPAIAMILARAFNAHVVGTQAPPDPEILAQQRKVAIVTEMIHTASLVRGEDEWFINQKLTFDLSLVNCQGARRRPGPR